MRTPVFITIALIGAWLWPATPAAWGIDVHRRITARAIDGLGPDIRSFFGTERAFIVEHSVDPDLWRVVALSGALGPEDANHFLDIDGLDEPAPYDRVPREWTAFVDRYGVERANQAGRLPWRAAEIYAKLVSALREARGGTSAYAAGNARYLAAVLAHYVEDAFVPFHAVANYDGQLTNQRGIHARFETALILRHERRFELPAVTVRPIGDVKTFVFETLVESAVLVPAILDADRRAVGEGASYDDAYFERFFDITRPVAELRLAEAADGVASVWTSAWIDAGRP